MEKPKSRYISSKEGFKWCEYWWKWHMWEAQEAEIAGDTKGQQEAINKANGFEDFIKKCIQVSTSRLKNI